MHRPTSGSSIFPHTGDRCLVYSLLHKETEVSFLAFPLKGLRSHPNLLDPGLPAPYPAAFSTPTSHRVGVGPPGTPGPAPAEAAGTAPRSSQAWWLWLGSNEQAQALPAHWHTAGLTCPDRAVKVHIGSIFTCRGVCLVYRRLLATALSSH